MSNPFCVMHDKDACPISSVSRLFMFTRSFPSRMPRYFELLLRQAHCSPASIKGR